MLAAFIYSMQRICEINTASRLRMSVSLKVLTGPYERPLPPLDWTVLHPVVQQYVFFILLEIRIFVILLFKNSCL